MTDPMNDNQPKAPTFRHKMEQTRQAAGRVNDITNRVLREAATIVEAEKLGIDPNEFRRLLRAGPRAIPCKWPSWRTGK